MFFLLLLNVLGAVYAEQRTNFPCISEEWFPSRIIRTGHRSCWVKFDLGESVTGCVSEQIWKQWLRQSSIFCVDQNKSLKFNYSSRVEFNQIKKINNHFSLRYFFFKKIEFFREKISFALSSIDSAGILRSLLLNENTYREPLGMLRQLGFVHLVSASGIHLVAWLHWFNGAIRMYMKFFRFSVAYGLIVRWVLSWSFFLLIWLWGGRSFGIVRPGFILFLKSLSKFLGFRWRSLAPLILALSLQFLFFPTIPLRGAMHYAFAVGGGLIWYHYFPSQHFGLAIGSWILVALIDIWEHGIVALATPWLSWITLPIICLLIYPAVVLGCLLFSFNDLIFIYFFKVIFLFLNPILTFLVKLVLLPWNLWVIPRWALIVGGIYFGFALIFIESAPHKKIKKIRFIYFGMSLLLVVMVRILVNNFIGSSESHDFRVASGIEQIDVGQGDAAWIRSSMARGWFHQHGLIDTGSHYHRHDVDWMHWLALRQITRLDWVGITHLDSDHSGGLVRLSQLVPIGCVAIPKLLQQTPKGQALIRALTKLNISVMDWTSNCIPYPTMTLGTEVAVANGIMGAVLVPLKKGGYYLAAGDARSQNEPQLNDWVEQLDVSHRFCQKSSCERILKINHHGSKTSSSFEFLKRFRPTQVWISVGAKNRYGHPFFLVLDRLNFLKIPIHRTDQEGSLFY